MLDTQRHFLSHAEMRRRGEFESVESGVWRVELTLARNVGFRMSATHKKPKAFPTPLSTLHPPHLIKIFRVFMGKTKIREGGFS